MFDNSERDLYEYAVISAILTGVVFIIAIIAGVILQNVLQSILLIIPFVLLRKYSGGYHAKKVCHCILGSCLLVYLFSVIAIYVECVQLIIGVTGMSALELTIFSPIGNESRKLDEDEKRAYKKITIILLGIVFLTALILCFTKLETYGRSMLCGIQLVACLQIPCIIKKLYNNYQNRRKTVI